MNVKRIDWNGHDLPEGLQDLPPGRYVVVPDQDAPELDEADIRAIEHALDHLDETVDHETARARILSIFS